MKKQHFYLSMMFVVILSLFSSCKTEDVQISDDSVVTTSNDEAQVSKISDEITVETDNYLSTAESAGFSLVKGLNIQNVATITGPTITVDKPDSTNFPKVVTIDFGTSGFINQRGDTIKGKLIVTITGKMYVANSSRTIVFSDFSINGNAVSGTKTVTYKGLNTSNNPYWTISADLTFTLKDGRTITWATNRTREHISNNNTPKILWDDTFSIKGTSNGVNAKGNNYSMVIDDNNPLILIGGFPFFVKGTATNTVKTRVAVIDFGDGTKDNKATVTINGVTKEITLRK